MALSSSDSFGVRVVAKSLFLSIAAAAAAAPDAELGGAADPPPPLSIPIVPLACVFVVKLGVAIVAGT